jgi:hypothetical protein
MTARRMVDHRFPVVAFGQQRLGQKGLVGQLFAVVAARASSRTARMLGSRNREQAWSIAAMAEGRSDRVDGAAWSPRRWSQGP